jgi:hypothetical protein
MLHLSSGASQQAGPLSARVSHSPCTDILAKQTRSSLKGKAQSEDKPQFLRQSHTAVHEDLWKCQEVSFAHLGLRQPALPLSVASPLARSSPAAGCGMKACSRLQQSMNHLFTF